MGIKSIGEWMPAPEPRSFGLDTGWWLNKEIEFSDGTKSSMTLGMGLTEELARTLAQRLNG